jgi:2-polyprenyl-3-methyl-5-hydroxy-6-metoxy-1,4-benzoquinol methylase
VRFDEEITRVMALEHTDNVDAAEVAKFNALASRWWDPEGDFRPLHEINPSWTLVVEVAF